MFAVPWFVLLVAGVDATFPFMTPLTVTVSMLLYAVCGTIWWTFYNDENNRKWLRQHSACESEHQYRYSVMEAAVALPTMLASVYLLFESYIPIAVFWVCLVVGVVGRHAADRVWQRNMVVLELI